MRAMQDAVHWWGRLIVYTYDHTIIDSLSLFPPAPYCPILHGTSTPWSILLPCPYKAGPFIKARFKLDFLKAALNLFAQKWIPIFHLSRPATFCVYDSNFSIKCKL